MNENKIPALTDLDEDLFEAAYYSDYLKVQALLTLGANPNAVQKEEYDDEIYYISPLSVLTMHHRSYYPEHVAYAAEALLRAGANVQGYDTDNKDMSPLHWAVSVNDAPLVKVLLAHGADANARDDLGYTPLHVLMGGYGFIGSTDEIYDSLLGAGADINAQSNMGQTAAHLLTHFVGSIFYHREILQSFIKLYEASADFEIKDAVGQTVLMSIQNFDAFSSVIGSEIVEEHLKIQYEEHYLDEKLVQACLDPLDNLHNIQKMLDLGANPNYLTMKQIWLTDEEILYLKTPLELLGDYYFSNNIEKMKLLLEYGADPNGGGFMPLKPIHSAAILREVDTVKLLLEKGVDINSQTADGDTALHLATKWCGSNNFDLMDFLIEKGIDLNIQNHRGQTAAHQLATCMAYDERDGELNNFEHLRKLTKLVEMGADLTIQDIEGSTVLSLVKGYERYEHAIVNALQMKTLHDLTRIEEPQKVQLLKISDILVSEKDDFISSLQNPEVAEMKKPIVQIETNLPDHILELQTASSSMWFQQDAVLEWC